MQMNEWKDSWDNISGSGYDVLTRLPSYNVLISEIVSHIKDCESVADLGCGTGNIIKLLVEENPGIERIVGVDYSPEMLEIAKKKLIRVDDGKILLYQSDVTQLSLEKESFDGAISNNVLFNLDNSKREPEKAIANAYNILRIGGIFVVSSMSDKIDPSFISKVYAECREAGIKPEEMKPLMDHNRMLFESGGMGFRPSKGTLETMLVSAGFKNVVFSDMLHYHGCNYLATAIKR